MIPFIDVPFVYAAGKVGASPDELKLVFSFLLSYPLAGLLKRVPDAKPAYKNIFIISASLFYLVGLFDLWFGLRTLFIDAAASYAIAKYLRGSPYMPWIGFVFLMVHMSVNQLERQFANNPSVVDITGAQMVLVMKLSAFCWNVADGVLPDDQLSEFQRDRVVRELPPLLDYAGYVLFFPGLMAGPPLDYAEYRRWIDTSMFEVPATIDPAKKPPTRRKRKIPRSGTPAMWKLAHGLAWILVFLNLGPAYSASAITGPSFMTHGFLRRVFIMHMVGFTARTKYYGVWALTEGACILAGLGYNGVDPVTGRVSWDRSKNVNPLGVELAQNTRAYLENWNMKTNLWLRNYMYLRVTPKGRKPGFRASMATFVTSAVWHGFYPGYYLTFVLASFLQTVAKNFRRYCRPLFLDPVTQKPLPAKRYYDFLSWLATQLAFSFAVAPFVLLSFSDSFRAWAQVYFYCIVGTIASMAFFASPAKAALKNRIEARQAKAAGRGAAAAGKKEGGGEGMRRSASTDSLNAREPLLGLPPDPEVEIDEIVAEIKSEVEKMQTARRNSMKTS